MRKTNTKNKKFIISHRAGKWKDAQENTIKAIQNTINSKNFDYVEIDLRRTKDKKIICYHNRTIKLKYIKKLNYKQIQKISNYHIPTFEEILKIYKNQIKFVIELKEIGYEKEIIKTIKKYLKHKDFIIISGNFKSIKKIKNIDNKIKTGYLIFKRNYIFYLKHKKEINKYSDFLNINKTIYSFFFRNFKTKTIWLWTFKNYNLTKKIKNKNIKGLTIDKF